MALVDPRKKKKKAGTTWVNRDNKIIQADAGRNKGRLFKEKVGQDVGKVRERQKTRRNALSILSRVKRRLTGK